MTTDQRLERLERQNRWMKAAVASMAVVLAVVLLVAAGQDREKDKPKVLEEVRAKKFVVSDSLGHEHGKLYFDDATPPGYVALDLHAAKDTMVRVSSQAGDSGGAGFGIYHDGKPRFTCAFAHAKGQPSLFMLDENGKARAGLFINDEGSPVLSIGDKHGKKRANLFFQDDSPMLSLTNENEQWLASLFVFPNNEVGLVLNDAKNRPRAKFRLQPDGSPRLEMYDENGKVIFKAPE
jgi:hypothetical protein